MSTDWIKLRGVTDSGGGVGVEADGSIDGVIINDAILGICVVVEDLKACISQGPIGSNCEVANLLDASVEVVADHGVVVQVVRFAEVVEVALNRWIAYHESL